MALRLKRAEVPVEQTWNLADIFATPDAWQAALNQATADYSAIEKHRGTIADGPSALLTYMQAAEDLIVRTNQIAWYADFSLSVDGGNAEGQAMAARVRPLVARANGLEAAMGSELVQLPDGLVDSYLDQEPRLRDYKTFIHDLTVDRPYMLSPEAEAALAALSEDVQRPRAIHQTATSADMKFPPAADSQGNVHSVSLGDFLMDTELRPDTTLRRNAWVSLTDTLSAYQNTLAANLNGHLGRFAAVAKLRGYPSAFHYILESRLHGMYGGRQCTSAEAFHRILDVIGAEVAPHMRRFARLRRRVLGLEKLYLCDVQAQLPAGPDLTLTWEQGRDWIIGATRVLGPEYTEIMERAYRERWIDWAVNEGKPGVAYSYLVPKVHPYVFSAFTGGMRSLFILAHELGHCGHEALSDRYQNYLNNRWIWFFGEAPSTLNELLLADHIRAQTDDPNIRKRVLLTTLATYHHNFVTHLLEADILRRLFRLLETGTPITAQTAGDVTIAALREFWGDEVELDERARLNWMRQPHYYMGLQPYTYAVGLAGSTALFGRIQAEGETAAQRWVEVLKAGSSLSADGLFQAAGVDMTSGRPLLEACAHVGRLVDELEQMY